MMMVMMTMLIWAISMTDDDEDDNDDEEGRKEGREEGRKEDVDDICADNIDNFD